MVLFGGDQECCSGQGAVGSTVLNRPWLLGHSWNMYGYDPVCKMLVTARGYVYDPSRMDWLRRLPAEPPFFVSASTVVDQSRHAAVARSTMGRNDPRAGLWLFSLDKGWVELSKPGSQLPIPLVDNSAFVYDSQRDRLLFGNSGLWGKPGKGDIAAFYSQDGRIERLNPAHTDLGILTVAREMVYVQHADWVLLGEPYVEGNESGSLGSGVLQRQEHVTCDVRAYDCAKNRWMLLRIDGFPDGLLASQGWIYDAKRRLVYVVNSTEWTVRALKLDPATVQVLTEKPQ